MTVEQWTYFHLPDAPPYTAGQPVSGSRGYGGSMPGWVSLSVGTTVTLHGVQGTYRVTRSHFHWGHDDEEPGMHIFLEEA
jgi:hypothetical protein